MTIKFNNVYVESTGTVTGPYERSGPLEKYFDHSYDDLYAKEPTWEQAEVRFQQLSIDTTLNKAKKSKLDIDLLISGDLLNQLVASSYTASRFGIPYFGVYSACSTSAEAIILGSSLIDSGKINNALCATSSHNLAAEKQFRYPTEYGGPKPKYSTFTTTGGASLLLSNKFSKIKVESGTIGRVMDMDQKDVFNMGAVMASAAGDTIYNHLKDTKREVGYYDLIITGDLGVYGKQILIEYLKTEHNLDITNNYKDAGTMIYDIQNQEVYAGGSGPACGPLVMYSYIFNKMLSGELERVLFVPTGALMNSTMVNQKLSIPSIAHAVSLEAYNDIR